MKFHLYKIKYNDKNSDIRKDIDRISRLGDDLKSRMRPIVDGRVAPLEEYDEDTVVRIVSMEKHESVSAIDGAVLMDIVEGRSDNLPGYIRDGKNQDLLLKKGDKVSQQTMAMVVPAKKERLYLICQYNHYGAKAARVIDYLGGGEPGYELEAVIDNRVMDRFEESDYLTGFSIRIATGEHDAAGAWTKDRSISNAMDTWGNRFNAGVLEISCGRGENKQGGALAKTAKSFLKSLSKDKRQNIEMVEATIKNFDARAEVLDLLNHRVFYEAEDEKLRRTKGQRYTYDSRKEAIIEAYGSLKPHMHG